MTTPTHLINALRSVIAPGSTHLDVRLSRSDIVLLLAHVDGLSGIALGTLQHAYRGNCPELDQLDARDPSCAACAVLGIRSTS